jgi:hypothetical protein
MTNRLSICQRLGLDVDMLVGVPKGPARRGLGVVCRISVQFYSEFQIARFDALPFGSQLFQYLEHAPVFRMHDTDEDRYLVISCDRRQRAEQQAPNPRP